MANQDKPADLGKLEAAEDRERTGLGPDVKVEAIIKVNREGYVPAGVSVRSRIDGQMFTGEFKAGVLQQIETDENVVSVSVAKRLRFID